MAESGTYQVEAIVGHTIKKGKNYFLVKWAGYPSSQNTWEPEENLEECREYLTTYLKPEKSVLQKASKKISKEKLSASSYDSKKSKQSKENSKKTKKSTLICGSEQGEVIMIDEDTSIQSESKKPKATGQRKTFSRKTRNLKKKKKVVTDIKTLSDGNTVGSKQEKKKSSKTLDNIGTGEGGSRSGTIELDIPSKIEEHTVLRNHFMLHDEGVCYFKIAWKQRPTGIKPASSWYEKETLMAKYPKLITEYYEKFIQME